MTAHVIAFQANTRNLWIQPDAGGPIDLKLGMMAGTSPSVAGLPGGGYVIAFQANTGSLWSYSEIPGAANLKRGVMPGTNPSVAAYSDGRYVIAFQADTGELRIQPDDVRLTNLKLGMMAGTSPSVAGLPGGGYVIAFQANTGNLWIQPDAGGPIDLKLGMMAGTSPSVAGLPGGGYVIAFQANTGNLWTYTKSDGGADLKRGVMPGTNPSVAAYSEGRYVIAFQADTGELRTQPDDVPLTNLKLGMMAGTSPSIAVGDDGHVIAFQANTGYLWSYRRASPANLELGMMKSASPAIADADANKAGRAACQQLAEQVQSLQAKLVHVVDDTARQDLLTRLTAVQSEQERLGCLATQLRSIGGTVTTWGERVIRPVADDFEGPRSSPVVVHLRIYEKTGQVEWWFEPFLFVDGVSWVELTKGYSATGQFDEESRALSLHATLTIVSSQSGSSNQGDIYLSTSDTITFPHQFTLSGSPIDENGRLVLVGEGEFDVSIGSANVWMQISGNIGATE